METTIKDHPLWAGATGEEIDNAIEVIIWWKYNNISGILPVLEETWHFRIICNICNIVCDCILRLEASWL